MELPSWLSVFGGGKDEELPDLYPLAIAQGPFVANDVQNIYARILTDVLERTQGIKDDQVPLLWDSCLKSESSEGLLTLLAKAMVNKNDLYLVYDASIPIIRKATSEEQQRIRDDYGKKAESDAGVYVSFASYTRTDMVKIYSALEYCAINGLNKSMGISTSIQFKMSKLRESVSLTDSAKVKAQAQAMAQAMSKGKNTLMDAADLIETGKPDLTATQSAIDFIAQKQSFYLGLPSSWITGLAPKGMGDSGEGESRAVERGLKAYYFSIIKPVCEQLFDVDTEFKSEDTRMLSTAMEVAKTFELLSGELVSKDNQRLILNRALGLPDDEEGDEIEEVPPIDQNVDPNAPPLPPGQKKPGAPPDPKDPKAAVR